MKKSILILAILIALAVPGSVRAASYFQAVTVADVNIGFSSAILSLPAINSVFCTLETAEIRFTIHGGGSPSGGEGHLLSVGQQLVISDRDSLLKFKAVRTGGVSGALKCSFYE